MNGDEQLESRLARLEAQLADLAEAVARLEDRGEPAHRPEPPAAHAVDAGVSDPVEHATPSPPPLPWGKHPAPAPMDRLDPPRPRRKEAPTPAGPVPAKSGRSLETLIGEQWFLWIGVLAGLVALGTLLKHSFEQGWITPAARFWSGIVSGVVLTVGGLRVERRLPLLGYGLMGAALGCFYLSFFAGARLLSDAAGAPLVSDNVAFLGMVATTILGTTLAATRNSRVVGGLAALGGYLTPALLSSGEDAQVFLFTYVAILTVGLLTVEIWHGWCLLDVGCLVGVALTFLGYGLNFGFGDVDLTLRFVAGFFVLFTLIPLLRGLRARRLEDDDPRRVTAARRGGTVQVVATLLTVSMLMDILKTVHPTWRIEGFVLIGMAALHGLCALGVRQLHGHTVRNSAVHVFVMMLLLALFPVAEPRIGNDGLGFAWALESAVLVLIGTRERSVPLRMAALGLLLLSCITFLIRVVPTLQAPVSPWWNALTPTFFTLVGLLGVLLWRDRHPPESRTTWWTLRTGLLSIVILVITWAFLTTEVYGVFHRISPTVTSLVVAKRNVMLLVTWSVAAFGLLAAGRRFGPPLLGTITGGGLALALTMSCVAFVVRVQRTLEDPVNPWWNDVLLVFVVLAALLAVLLFRGRNDTHSEELAGGLSLGMLVVSFAFLVAEVFGVVHALYPEWAGFEVALSAQALMCSWALCALGFLLAGRRYSLRPMMLLAGLGILAAVLGTLMSLLEGLYHSMDTLFWNPRFAFGIPVAGVVLFIPRVLEDDERVEPDFLRNVSIVGHGLVITLLSVEANDLFLREEGRALVQGWLDPSRATAFSWSILWTLYSLGLVVRGIAARNATLRIAALLFLLVTVFKVFLFDLSFLTGVGRVLSFLILGIILVLTSALYQRYKDRIGDS